MKSILGGGAVVNPLRPNETQRRRRLVASLVLLIGLAAIAVLPAAAAPPSKTPPTAGISTVSGTTCTFHVTYSWSGISGPVNAYLRVVYQIPGQQFATLAAADNVAVSGRSGSTSVDLVVTGQGFQSFHGRGSLQNKKNQEIAGSEATSSTSIAVSC
jgi:hypothetical protein